MGNGSFFGMSVENLLEWTASGVLAGAAFGGVLGGLKLYPLMVDYPWLPIVHDVGPIYGGFIYGAVGGMLAGAVGGLCKALWDYYHSES
jgi:hypothetical protein